MVVTTGWPPGLLQDDSRELSRWFASRPDARYVLRKHLFESTAMNFKTHNEVVGIKIDGTSYQGQIEADYDELERLLGLSMDGDGYKTDAEWWIQFRDGTVATIYNWKNGHNYLGEDGLDLEQIHYWNVGGKSKHALDLVNEMLEQLHV